MESVFKDNMINVQLSKTRDFETENTGVINITNISIENTQSFADVLNPFFLGMKYGPGTGRSQTFCLLSLKDIF